MFVRKLFIKRKSTLKESTREERLILRVGLREMSQIIVTLTCFDKILECLQVLLRIMLIYDGKTVLDLLYINRQFVAFSEQIKI